MDFCKFALEDKEPERLKREKKAASAECTPLAIVPGEKRGVFSGSSGQYNTWLSECECMDFKRRGLPCKHMYRLASELGLYDLGPVKSDQAQIKRKISPKDREAAYKKCVSLIEKYPEKVRQELHRVLAYRYRKEAYVCENIDLLAPAMADGLLETVADYALIIERHTQKRTVEGLISAGFVFPDGVKPTKKARFEWCLQHPADVCAVVYPECFTVRTSGPLEVACLKVYTYLNQKYEGEDHRGLW